MEKESDRPDSTDGPGNISVDEPTQPAMTESDEDDFDKQADRPASEDSGEEKGS